MCMGNVKPFQKDCIIPFFKELLKNGASELPITHKDMTRFLLTLDHAVDLIKWSYEHPKSHGKIVIPKIKALKITDIAESLGRAYKIGTAREITGEDIRLKYIGIRPGEKLHEAMISETKLLTKKVGHLVQILA